MSKPISMKFFNFLLYGGLGLQNQALKKIAQNLVVQITN